MRRIRVACPASCGELFQCVLGNRECLLSYGISRRSFLTLEYGVVGSKTVVQETQMRQVLSGLKGVKLSHHREVAVGKGYSSSTADLVVSLQAVSVYEENFLTAATLTSLCAQLEPTDSVAFADWTVIDPLSGQVIWQTDWRPELYVYVLEPKDRLDTTTLSRMIDSPCYPAQESAALLPLFQEACQNRDQRKLGELATLSARLNNHRLPKPYLEELIQLAQDKGGLGINVAHSGTILGILLDDCGRDRLAELEETLEQSRLSAYYSKRFLSPIIYEGVTYQEGG